jgi:hypothetical protein
VASHSGPTATKATTKRLVGAEDEDEEDRRQRAVVVREEALLGRILLGAIARSALRAFFFAKHASSATSRARKK